MDEELSRHRNDGRFLYLSTLDESLEERFEELFLVGLCTHCSHIEGSPYAASSTVNVPFASMTP